jgi:hypothetical protein
MAREAGAIEMRDNGSMGWGCEFELHQLEAFAKLVAQHEREACAKVCEQHGYDHYCGNVTDKIAETIRARGDKHD